jgi:hypothetical protein
VRAKVKRLPPAPKSVDAVWEAHDAVALVPKPEESCCARLMDRADVPAQDEAKEWLTFLKGLGLVAEGERGFHRLGEDPDGVDLAIRFREGVYGVIHLLDRLGAEPVDADSAFEAFEDRVPNWERAHEADWRRVWRERVTRMLAWATLLGLAERVEVGYVAAGADTEG